MAKQILVHGSNEILLYCKKLWNMITKTKWNKQPRKQNKGRTKKKEKRKTKKTPETDCYTIITSFAPKKK